VRSARRFCTRMVPIQRHNSLDAGVAHEGRTKWSCELLYGMVERNERSGPPCRWYTSLTCHSDGSG
jgi:hypothetical protein